MLLPPCCLGPVDEIINSFLSLCFSTNFIIGVVFVHAATGYMHSCSNMQESHVALSCIAL